jgi:hypothetical protein
MLAVAGYAFFLGGLEPYYYFSIMPAAVLTVLLGTTVLLPDPVRRAVAVMLLIGSVYMVPARLRFAATMHRMPEYGVLVDGSRKILRTGQPMRAIRTEFALPPTSDAEFVYRILGGRLDRQSPWVGIITSDGSVLFHKATGS